MNETVSETLRTKLRTWIMPKPRSRVSLRECAKECGVSASTISRFLGGKPITSTGLDALTAWAEKYERDMGEKKQ
jgi:transcriptional regulator with XRE-family HTH domain